MLEKIFRNNTAKQIIMPMTSLTPFFHIATTASRINAATQTEMAASARLTYGLSWKLDRKKEIMEIMMIHGDTIPRAAAIPPNRPRCL